MKDSFVVRKKYRNQIQKLTTNQRSELMYCVFSYQLEWKYESEDWAVCMLLDIMIDEWKNDDEKYLEMCEKNREIALEREKKKRLRKEKSHEQHERAKSSTNVTVSTDNDSDSDNIHKHNTNIILKNDTETKVSEYWNHDINECLNLIKSFNWWLLDWTVKNNRRYAKLLIDKLKNLESIKSWKYTRNGTLELILNVISQNKYHASKITSAESIYRNLAVLIQTCKNDIWKAQSNQIILPTI